MSTARPVTPFVVAPPERLWAEGFHWIESGLADALGLTDDAMAALVWKHLEELSAHGLPPVAGARASAVPGVMVPVHALNATHVSILFMVAEGEAAQVARRTFLRVLSGSPQITRQRLAAARPH